MEKEIEFLKMKEMELLQLASNQTRPGPSVPRRRSSELSALHPLFAHAEIMHETFIVSQLPLQKPGPNLLLCQELRANFTFRDYPNDRVTVVLSPANGRFHTLKAIDVDTGNEEINTILMLVFFNRQLSNIECPMYVRLLRGFLSFLKDFAAIQASVKASLSNPDDFIVSQYEQNDEWIVQFALGGVSTCLGLVYWHLSFSSGFDVTTHYRVELSPRGQSKARKYFFPEELVMGKRYDSWSAKKCITELIKLVMLEADKTGSGEEGPSPKIRITPRTVTIHKTKTTPSIITTPKTTTTPKSRTTPKTRTTPKSKTTPKKRGRNILKRRVKNKF